MPCREIAFPVGATTQQLVDRDGTTYDVSSHTITRASADGDIPVLQLFMGDRFTGEILEAGWRKGWTSDMDADQAFVARLDTTNHRLNLLGEADVAGTYGYGWLNQNNPVTLLKNTEIIVDMEVPVSDTGATADRDIQYHFALIPSKVETRATAETDYLNIRINVDEDGLLTHIYKKVNNSATILWDGSTKDGSSSRDPNADRFWKFKLVFKGKPGTSGANLWVYAKTGDTRANMEADSWERLNESGTDVEFDISDLTFHVGYPCFEIWSQNTTYYDDASPAVTDSIEVSYPDFTVDWGDPSITDNGSVQLWDGSPDGGGTRVYSTDHSFSGDTYTQNSLIRLHVDELVADGLKLYGYISSAWTRVNAEARFYLESDAKFVSYPELKHINQISSESVSMRVRLHNTASADDDYYVDVDVTLRRGSYGVEFEVVDVYPEQDFRFRVKQADTKQRFSYAGDNKIGDADISSSGTNTALSDNYLVGLDDAGDAVLLAVSSDLKPTSFQTLTDASLYLVTFTSSERPKLFVSAIPFSQVSNLFVEAEDATISASARQHLDGDGKDTVTEGQAVWAGTTNCAVDVNNATGVSVGSKNVKITSSGAGAVVATCTPASPLGKLTKFDDLKLYLHGDPSTVTIRLKDGSGGDVSKSQAITGSATQYTIPLPHSASDLQGWTDNGFDFTDFTTLTVEWTASGAGEAVYVDGLHEYIGTTTTRGRGETLSGGEAAVFDSLDEKAYWRPVAGTDLPAGRYLFVVRLKDTDQYVNDIRQDNVAESGEYRNKENAEVNFMATNSFACYIRVFDITEDDVSNGYYVQQLVGKNTGGENTILVDSFLIIPLGDGHDLPMDLAHNAIYAIEPEQTVEADGLKVRRLTVDENGELGFRNGLRQISKTVTVGDDESHTLPRGLNGFGFVQVGDNEEYAWFTFNREADVTLVSNSANVVNTDTDAKFCIIDGGGYVALKNRLGSSKKVKYVVWSE